MKVKFLKLVRGVVIIALVSVLVMAWASPSQDQIIPTFLAGFTIISAFTLIVMFIEWISEKIKGLES